MREMVTLEITTLRGSIGGEHWYGTLHVRTKETPTVRPDGSVGWSVRMGHSVERHPADRTEVRRRIGAKEAAYLNRKDSDGIPTPHSARLKPGDMVARFNDRDSIEAAAVAAFAKAFDETDVLAIETYRYSGVHRPLAGPADVVAALAADQTNRGQDEALIAMGYLRKPMEDEIEGMEKELPDA